MNFQIGLALVFLVTNFHCNLALRNTSILVDNECSLVNNGGEGVDRVPCKEVRCPRGTYVMKLIVELHYNDNSVGFCHRPGERHPAAEIYFAYIVPDKTAEFDCGLGPVRGIRNNEGGGCGRCPGAPDLPEFHCCMRNYSGVDCQTSSSSCPPNEAVTGFRHINEDKLYNTRQAFAICTEIEHPASTCNPRDLFDLIVVCDMLEALGPSHCRYSQKIGFGNSSSMSESERRELTFYSEVGFEFGASGYGLSSSFSGKLGQSATTGYDWTRASGQTWNVETTIEVSMEIPAGIHTSLFQAVGRCSFYNVDTNFYKRVDRDSRGRIVSQNTFTALSMQS